MSSQSDVCKSKILPHLPDIDTSEPYLVLSRVQYVHSTCNRRLTLGCEMSSSIIIESMPKVGTTCIWTQQPTATHSTRPSESMRRGEARGRNRSTGHHRLSLSLSALPSPAGPVQTQQDSRRLHQIAPPPVRSPSRSREPSLQLYEQSHQETESPALHTQEEIL